MPAYQTSFFAYQGAGQFAYQEQAGVPVVVTPPPGGSSRKRRYVELKKYKRIALESIYKARREQLEPSKRLQVATRKVAEDLARPGVAPELKETLTTVLLPFVKVMGDLRNFPDAKITELVDWKAVAADTRAVPQLIELHITAEMPEIDLEDDDDDWLLLVS